VVKSETSKLYLEIALFLHLPSKFELQRGVKDCKFQTHTKNSKWPEMRVQNRKKTSNCAKCKRGARKPLACSFEKQDTFWSQKPKRGLTGSQPATDSVSNSSNY